VDGWSEREGKTKGFIKTKSLKEGGAGLAQKKKGENLRCLLLHRKKIFFIFMK
jgi:hypothetical protein